jgi:hypothetical protein
MTAAPLVETLPARINQRRANLIAIARLAVLSRLERQLQLAASDLSIYFKQ